MSKAHYPTTAAIKRQADAARAAGLEIGGVVSRPDGTIVILDVKAARREAEAGANDADKALAEYEDGLAPSRRA